LRRLTVDFGGPWVFQGGGTGVLTQKPTTKKKKLPTEARPPTTQRTFYDTRDRAARP